uniref:Coronin n=1 Tax=Salmo trutta TaxID=8032 RepID=A0A674DBU6_SALTR
MSPTSPTPSLTHPGLPTSPTPSLTHPGLSSYLSHSLSHTPRSVLLPLPLPLSHTQVCPPTSPTPSLTHPGLSSYLSLSLSHTPRSVLLPLPLPLSHTRSSSYSPSPSLTHPGLSSTSPSLTHPGLSSYLSLSHTPRSVLLPSPSLTHPGLSSYLSHSLSHTPRSVLLPLPLPLSHTQSVLTYLPTPSSHPTQVCPPLSLSPLSHIQVCPPTSPSLTHPGLSSSLSLSHTPRSVLLPLPLPLSHTQVCPPTSPSPSLTHPGLSSYLSLSLSHTPRSAFAMVPKLALDVLSCEVMRVLQLTDSFIVPINYHVPRKSGQDFHADLYPDTLGRTAAMSAAEWWKGAVVYWPYTTPTRALLLNYMIIYCICITVVLPLQEAPVRGCSTSSSPLSSPSSSAAPSRSPSSTSGLSSGFQPSPSQSVKAISSMLGPSSKFRHLQGAVLHRDTHFTNLKGLNLTTPGECDGFCANRHRVAVPLASAGGQIAIFELSQAGKLADTGLPTIQNSVNVADFSWDPFNSHRLVVAGDDAKIRVWQVPEGGLTETLTEPEAILQGHTEKIYSVKFHPLASGLLASSSYDQTVRLWNLESGDEVKALRGHQDQIFGMAWSPDGKLLATVCKDGKLRIYDPRKSADPVQEGAGPEGHRGARVVWVCDGKYLMVSGFDSRSERTLYLHSAESLSSGAIASAPTDVSPSTLIPFYDPDTSVVILTGKGDTRVYIFEIVPEAPYFLECASFNSSEPHKGLAFLPKTECVVQEVEVARGLRLSKTSIEPVVFRVPRVRKEFFQDDVYPDTVVWWESSLTASAWLAGSDGKHHSISLKPKDMTPVSEAPKEVQVRKYLPSSHYLEEKTDEQKKDELLSAMIGKLGNMDDNPLPQESFQGVEDDEWDQICFPPHNV